MVLATFLTEFIALVANFLNVFMSVVTLDFAVLTPELIDLIIVEATFRLEPNV